MRLLFANTNDENLHEMELIFVFEYCIFECVVVVELFEHTGIILTY